MRQTAPSIAAPSKAPLSSFLERPVPAVLSEFYVDGQQFLIISLDNNSESRFLSNKNTDRSKNYIEVDRFQVQGQTCAIVKIERNSAVENSVVETPAVEIDLVSLLTERELQIATLVASGQANKQIAHQLCISEWTVSTHLRRIFIKLGVDSRAAMVYRCAAMIQKLSEQFTKQEETSRLK